MLNEIQEKELSKNCRVKVKNFPGDTSETIANEVEQLVSSKSDCIFVGTNDHSKQVNILDKVRKIIKNVQRSFPNTRVVFLNFILQKDKTNLSKKRKETNRRLKNYTTQKISILLKTIIYRKNIGSEKIAFEQARWLSICKEFITLS